MSHQEYFEQLNILALCVRGWVIYDCVHITMDVLLHNQAWIFPYMSVNRSEGVYMSVSYMSLPGDIF